MRARLIVFAHSSLRQAGWRLMGASLDLMARKGPSRRLARPCARLSDLLMRMATRMERRGWVDRLVGGGFMVRE